MVTCRWKQRGCGSRLAVELESGTGLAGQDLCPRCGEAGAVRHLLVASRRRWPNRVWTVRAIQVVAQGDAATSAAAPT
jgi:hypothetical protein